MEPNDFLLVVGRSELVEAEYASRCEEKYTVYEWYCNEPVAIMGYNSKARVLEIAKDARKNGITVHEFWR